MSKLAQFPFVPTLCTVWIGKENGWLHKAELEGEKPVQGSVTRITFEFLNPRFDEELPEALFAFEPPSGVRAEDQTDVMYQRLSAILQQAQNSDRGPAGAPAGPLGEPAVKAPVNAPTTPNP